MENMGGKAWKGVETIDTESKSTGPSSINFYHEGNVYMEQKIIKVKSNYSKNQGFEGVPIRIIQHIKN